MTTFPRLTHTNSTLGSRASRMDFPITGRAKGSGLNEANMDKLKLRMEEMLYHTPAPGLPTLPDSQVSALMHRTVSPPRGYRCTPHPMRVATGPGPAKTSANRSTSSSDTPASPADSAMVEEPTLLWNDSHPAVFLRISPEIRPCSTRRLITAQARNRSRPGSTRITSSEYSSYSFPPGQMEMTFVPFFRALRTMAARCTDPRYRSRPQLTMTPAPARSSTRL